MSKGTVTYCSPFVPAEWIAAHGLTPYRMAPLGLVRDIRQGQCPFARAFVQEAQSTEAAGVVFATTCDQMRRSSETLDRANLPVFTMNVPATWQSDTAAEMYLDELRRLGRFLQAIGGQSPDFGHLAAVVRQYDQARRRLIARPERAREFQESLREMHQLPLERLQAWSPPVGRQPCEGIGLAVLGGPLPQTSLDLLDDIELSGGKVVLDATETGRRCLPSPPDGGRLSADPLAELARMYFGGIGDAFRRPNTLLYDWLGAELSRSGAQGIILIHQVWCDLWHAELGRLREWTRLPVLQIVDGGDLTARASARTRIQSFLEMLR